MRIADSLGLAKQHHQAGRLAEAEALYREILSAEPQHPDALHFLGVIAHQSGRSDIAVEMIRQALALIPNNPGAHSNLGNVLRDNGRLDEAIGAYRRALELNPGMVGARNSLASALQEEGRPDEAIAAWREALALQPGVAAVHCNLGNALRSSGHLDEAIGAFHRALELDPDLAAAHYSLAQALRDQGQFDQAITAYRRTLQLQPDYAEGHGTLGRALQQQGRLEEATAAYRMALLLQPDSPEYHYLLAGLTGDHSATTAPASYVRQVFDSYAGTFDEHLVGKLNYRVPELLFEAVLDAAPGRKFDVLDLGCGTGLCGAQFRAVARSLVGVDLAPKMLEKAAARGIYDRLVCGEALATLQAETGRFDLILAGDVFVYVGDLSGVFPAAARALRDAGLLAFSLERHDGEGYVLRPTARFVHSLAYIRDLSRKHGFTEISTQEIAVRREGLRDVPGWLVVLQQSADGQQP